MKFSNTYIGLGKQFYQRILPQKVPMPKLLLWNSELANSLFISDKLQNDQELLSQYFSGNELPDGAESIALAYSGHQFGHFNPQLGDGRAHLLGEVVDQDNVRRDIQLKGSGQTTFSRRGDGKCALAPALREYIMSEAMFALGVPTSRCLAVVSTGEVINRGLAKAGAVVTRVAQSHIRVGSFQYFAARGDTTSLKSLLDYSIERHFPEINKPEINKPEIDKLDSSQEQRVLQFLECAIDKQITLIIQWLRVGFIHGVMNTDNTVICGETIDFGPCAMMGKFDEKAVFSSIDEYGRYAFGNQGDIAQWNMARLADCLLSLLLECNDDFNDASSKKEHEQQALEKIEAIIQQYKRKFDEAYYAMYSHKLGMNITGLNITALNVSSSENKAVVDDLLSIMQNKGLDYTQTFYRLTQSLTDSSQADELKTKLGDWYQAWLAILESSTLEPSLLESSLLESSLLESSLLESDALAKAQALMQQNNPVVIPRNHHVEQILARCEAVMADESQHLTVGSAINGIVDGFLKVLRSPYNEIDTTKNYQDTPVDGDSYYQTFCGT